MKKNVFLLLILFGFSSFGQELNFKEDFDKSYKRSDYKTYISKDSIIFRVNDEIKIGAPSDLTFKYIFIFQSLGYLKMSVAENRQLDGKCKIIAISIAGSKAKGFFPYIQIANESGTFFSVEIEKAIPSGEIVTKLSENEILEA
ncbi:hypothetical protein NAL32_19870 [Chryseobacterium sp. Ch-15]|uniref:Uncharacterized protein n=1 Tax=Chryseobacterium muglaense TaxID=2893752 RepID=A0A9Q3YUI8_9FLAO|nr:hypothetical protein [Chryseobacterium muglaense]MBD3906940.1 hypothetical protein [Chryseobacterium muglaense]MCC9033730.1 hypothetical protein [Chryseobacterium muglaense]MCM2556654.1 hypothetical protein [Chryseobacterium muglaense]